MNTHAIDLFKEKEQYLFIDSKDQRGLDLFGTFTIEAWICLASLPSESNLFTILMKHDRVASTGGYELYINRENKLVFEYGDDDSKNTTASCDYIFTKNDINIWKHVAVVVNVAIVDVQFYIGSIEQKTILNYDDAKSIQKNSFPVIVGATWQNEGSVSFFDGSIDELRVWSLLRTQKQIKEHQKKELKGDEDGLLAYWSFNNSFEDITKNNNVFISKNSVEYILEVPFEGITEQKKNDNPPRGYVTFF